MGVKIQTAVKVLIICYDNKRYIFSLIFSAVSFYWCSYFRLLWGIFWHYHFYNFGALVSALGPRPVWNDNFYLKIFNSFEWICTTCQGFTEIISSRNSNFFQAKAGRGRHDIFLGHHTTCLMTWTNQTFVDNSNFVSVLRLLNFVNNLTPDAQPSTMFVRFFLGPR